VDKFKKLIADYQDHTLLVIEIAIGVIGVFVASLTVYRYEVIVRAALGFTVIYLLYREYVVLKSITKGTYGGRFESPKDIKYLVVDFLAVIFMIWSGVQVVELIRYLIRIFPR